MVTWNFSAKYVLAGIYQIVFCLGSEFSSRKKPCHGYPTEVGDWEGKMGTDIITQMIFSGFLNEVCYCIWNEVSAMIKSF